MTNKARRHAEKRTSVIDVLPADLDLQMSTALELAMCCQDVESTLRHAFGRLAERAYDGPLYETWGEA